MPSFSFPHSGRVFVIADDRFEVAYYAHGYQKYKRVREIAFQSWSETMPEEIDHDHFWMVVACIERGKESRLGVV